ncbi:hypothetical protein PIB30_098207, partial [Stylosanthes scabra]|nr:hypothetical protein [Stylosanthes scabra]
WKVRIPKGFLTSSFWRRCLGLIRIDNIGNKNKQILKFDPEIERTLRELRKQSKQVLEGSSKEFSKKSLIILNKSLITWLLKELRRKLWENILFPLLSATAVA